MGVPIEALQKLFKIQRLKSNKKRKRKQEEDKLVQRKIKCIYPLTLSNP